MLCTAQQHQCDESITCSKSLVSASLDQRAVIVKPRYGIGRRIPPLRYLSVLQLEQPSVGAKGSPENVGIFHLTSNLPSSLYFLDSKCTFPTALGLEWIDCESLSMRNVIHLFYTGLLP